MKGENASARVSPRSAEKAIDNTGVGMARLIKASSAAREAAEIEASAQWAIEQKRRMLELESANRQVEEKLSESMFKARVEMMRVLMGGEKNKMPDEDVQKQAVSRSVPAPSTRHLKF